MSLDTDYLAPAAIRLAERYLSGDVDQRQVDRYLKATRPGHRAEGVHLGLWQTLVTAIGNRDLYHLGELSAVAVCGHGNPVIAEAAVQDAVTVAADRFAGDA